MGVLGLTPFIQKTCPEVIKRLPDRLQGFSGKKIVLDGTLLTQRFHFAQIPHPRRHVLGWYRLIKELEQYSVEAICVFDGKGRNLAKAQEALRRKNAQRLAAARAVIENERLSRLTRISSAVRNIAKFSLPQKVQVSSALTQLALKHLDKSETGKKGILSLIKKSTMEDVDLENLSWIDSESWTVGNPAENDSMHPRTSTVDDVLSTLTPLFLEYQDSLVKVAYNPMHAAKASISHSDTDISTVSDDAVVNGAELEAGAAQEVYDMSKRQCQLTLQEGEFWDSLTSTLGSEPELAPVELHSHYEGDAHHKMLQELTHKSNIISESYRISTHPPTSQTYAESKEILQAMGVPCIDCDGPFEAEALASSLVLNGYADYVASEDTDVIIYEAPLIRNITSRHQPLLVISGAELRSMLNLTRSMFVDFALLLGTDFSQRIRQVGPTRALDFIRAHGSIEKVIEAETRFKPKVSREDYLKQVNIARKVFQTLPPIPEDAVVKSRDGDAGQVLFVMGKYGLSREIDCDSEDALRGNYFDDNPSQW
ncbi:PIN domain-like protein [Lentinula novae-zelandiae]|nr:PIN domain-like protein [Lentinula novae-zelandiae]